MFLMNNHPSNKNKRVVFKLPRNIEVGRHHDKSISIMTSEVNANHNIDNHPSNECIGDKMKTVLPYSRDLLDDETSDGDKEEDTSNEVVDEEEDQSNDGIEEEEENQ